MFSEFLSFCFMGVSSNLEVFLSEKHLNDHSKDPEFIRVLTRPAMEEINDEECQASTKEGHDHQLKTRQQTVLQEQRDHDEQDEDHHQLQPKSNDNNAPELHEALSGLKLKIPTYKEVEEEIEKEESSNDGFKTPTSEEYRIPAMLECPPAPRRPRATPSSSKKRKGCCRSRTVLDLSQEIESFFPTVDRGAGGKSKKVKLFTEPQ